jgi:hypothetical protein
VAQRPNCENCSELRQICDRSRYLLAGRGIALCGGEHRVSEFVTAPSFTYAGASPAGGLFVDVSADIISEVEVYLLLARALRIEVAGMNLSSDEPGGPR